MDIDLSLLNMNKGQLYESIITSKNEVGEKNAAPFGVTCRGNDEIMLKIFKGSKSLENILKTKKFIVNITSNPLYFTQATIDTIDSIYFEENNSLKDSDAYFECEVIEIKEATRKDSIKISEAMIIIAKVTSITINKKYTKALNRAIYSLIESLVDFSRIDIVDENTREDYIIKFKKSKRLIFKVGSKEEKESIKLVENKLKEKGFI